MSKPAAVYRLYGADGRLLYVGASSKPQARFYHHKDSAPWWGEVVSHTVSWHESKQAALAAETAAIYAERPLHNVYKVNGETRNRNFRVKPEIWDPALAKAHAEGRSLTDVITAYLRRYISTPPRKRNGDGG